MKAISSSAPGIAFGALRYMTKVLPDEVKAKIAVKFLASEEAGYITETRWL